MKPIEKGADGVIKNGHMRAIADKEISETEELRLLVQAATQKMKDDHRRMMRKARVQIAWLLFLVGCAIAYEIWAIPALEKWMGIR